LDTSVPEIIVRSLVGNKIYSLSVSTWNFIRNTKIFFKNDACFQASFFFTEG